MKTKVERHISLFAPHDFFKMTLTRPTIGPGKRYEYYFTGSELDKLIEQIKKAKDNE